MNLVFQKEEKDIVKNYIYIVSRIKNEIKKELTQDKEEWVKLELNNILQSLNKKLERKIVYDIKEELIQKNNKNLQENQNVLNYLGLLKCLQVEGDVDLDQNQFYLNILQQINNQYGKDSPEASQKMHDFSNKIFMIIENYKQSEKQFNLYQLIQFIINGKSL